ncbi:MAG: SprB repeat-containing protein, partial [Candidatus Aenigmarchaeota archaeon]|nr:SprB repeat-containing protein [Candidatus Aenigmarchaeota archaeon]
MLVLLPSGLAAAPLTVTPASIIIAVDGSATVTASGGTAPYDYGAVGIADVSQNSNVFMITGTTSGSDTLILYDNNGNSVGIPLTVTGSSGKKFVTDVYHTYTGCGADLQSNKDNHGESICTEDQYTCLKQGTLADASKFLFDALVVNDATASCPPSYVGDTPTIHGGKYGKDPIQVCRLYVSKGSDGKFRDPRNNNVVTTLIDDAKLVISQQCPAGYRESPGVVHGGDKCLEPYRICYRYAEIKSDTVITNMDYKVNHNDNDISAPEPPSPSTLTGGGKGTWT